MRRNWPCALGAFAALSAGGLPGIARADYVTTVVMTGLENPRGLAFGPDGSLYVAEAGRGGPGPSIILGDGATNFYGASGAVSRLTSGGQQRVATGLPSLAPTSGGGATGPHDIVFNGAGQAFAVIGFGADPALRSTLGAAGAGFGTVVQVPLGGGPVTTVADVAAHERVANPDGREFNSNPYGLLARGGGFLVADAGANAILSVTPAGVVSTLVALPFRPNPLPFGPPTIASVPTSLAVGLDGTIYVGELTGGPFPPGFANVYRLDPVTGDLTTAFTGFTNIIDLAVGPDGSLYVLQISANGLASPTGPVPGALFRIDPLTGLRTQIPVPGLVFPGGVTVGPDGSIYVSNLGTSPGGGQVVRITAVATPEPAAVSVFALLLVGLLGYLGYRARHRVTATP